MNALKSVQNWTTGLALLLIIVCLFRPTAPASYAIHRYLFVIDVTESMNVRDVGDEAERLSRLELAREAVRQTILSLHCESEAGLAIFTEHRTFPLITPVKICDNFTELSSIIDHIDWRMAWRSQSEVSKGLNSAIRINEAIDGKPRLVFITDGHESPPVHPDLRQKVRKVDGQDGFIVGVGGDTPQPIPKLADNGKILGYWHPDDVEQYDRFTAAVQNGESITGVTPNPDFTGKEHLSSLKQSYLQQLADEVGFRYTRLQKPAETADLLKSVRFGATARSPQDARPLLLKGALLLLLIGYLWSMFKMVVQAKPGLSLAIAGATRTQ